jgi:hypothetical protein
MQVRRADEARLPRIGYGESLRRTLGVQRIPGFGVRQRPNMAAVNQSGARFGDRQQDQPVVALRPGLHIYAEFDPEE